MDREPLDRREFLTVSVAGLTCLSTPRVFGIPSAWFGTHAPGGGEGSRGAEVLRRVEEIRATIRPPTLFAGIRKPIQDRRELDPRIERLRAVCGDRIAGPLTHIVRYDTPVDGHDSEIGFPVREAVNVGEVRTHTLRSMHFFSNIHEGPLESLPETRGRLYAYMDRVGLSPELEVVEVFHRYDTADADDQRVECMASFLPWPETYREELARVLGGEVADVVWQGGEAMTPHTPVDERARWVAASIDRLKAYSSPDQQFDVLSRVALVRPPENIARRKAAYDETGDIAAFFDAWREDFLAAGRTLPWVDPPTFDGRVLHMSKVPYDEAGYLAATTPEEIRKAYCFCALVREAEDPRIDPIFCYRAAGWARQLMEPVLGVAFTRCEITHSILKGDPFCAWDYHLE